MAVEDRREVEQGTGDRGDRDSVEARDLIRRKN
jgi:hypothetical protein